MHHRHPWRLITGAAIIAVSLAVSADPVAPQETTGNPQPRDILETTGFTSREIANIDREVPVARVLDTDRRQIAVIGAVKIRASRERLANRFRSIDYLKGSGNVLNAGQFRNPPDAADLGPLRFEEYDLDVGGCRPGDCRVRLSAADIARFERDVNWKGPDWKEQSAAVWRRTLSHYAAAYADGPASLPVYANKEEPLSVEAERKLLLDQLDALASAAPEMHAYLRDPSRGRPRGLEELTYWTVEDFGVRPVVRVVHQALYRPARPGAPLAIATDQIYAAHYLDASIGFALALDVPGEEGRAFYLVLTNRSRTRSLTGLLRTMVRSTVQRRSRDAVAKILTSTKAALEATAPTIEP